MCVTTVVYHIHLNQNSFSTGSNTPAATFCSQCFQIVALTLTHCTIGDMTSY